MKVGDVVELKSGGPMMTITGAHEDKAKTFYCAFFNHSHEKFDYVCAHSDALSARNKTDAVE